MGGRGDDPRTPRRDPGLIAVGPEGPVADLATRAVVAAGGTVAPVGEATALVWCDPHDADGLRDHLHDGIAWVQLPWAGIEPLTDVIDDRREWTCGKGVYADPVAEHALALVLALLRNLGPYARAGTWTGPAGRNLFGARVTVLGAGGIAESLARLLAPFEVDLTVVRRDSTPFPAADRTVPLESLDAVLPETGVLVLALALTPETEGVLDAARIGLLPSHAVVVNVARGAHIDTDALADALAAGRLAGAGLDVTDPEPLPDDHPLWDLPTCIITPHVGNTPEMAAPLLTIRIRANVARWLAGEPLLGPVDVDAGY